MTSNEALTGVKSVLLDTAPVVYAVENHVRFFAPTEAILREAGRRCIRIVVSSLTLAEVLSKSGTTDERLQDYLDFCTGTEGIVFQATPFDANFAIQVGRLRRATNLKLPDCIQFASAEALFCDAILTNDRQFARWSGRTILVEEIEVAP